jgi:ribonuclease HII
MVTVGADVKYKPQKGELIVGVDEVGRGCWAGPLVVGAVLIEDGIVEGVIDSKRMTRAKRDELAPRIMQEALAWGLGWVTAEEIDELGLQMATKLGIKKALEKIQIPYDTIIIDGSVNFLPNNKKTIAKISADNYLYSVSAASIIAKVARDDYMTELAAQHPEYGFDKHVGYGTESHIKVANEIGIVAGLHRIKNVAPVRAIYERFEAEKVNQLNTEVDLSVSEEATAA